MSTQATGGKVYIINWLHCFPMTYQKKGFKDGLREGFIEAMHLMKRYEYPHVLTGESPSEDLGKLLGSGIALYFYPLVHPVSFYRTIKLECQSLGRSVKGTIDDILKRGKDRKRWVIGL